MDNQENANCIPHEPVFSKCRGCDKLQRAYLMMNSETNLSRLIYDDDVNEINKRIRNGARIFFNCFVSY